MNTQKLYQGGGATSSSGEGENLAQVPRSGLDPINLLRIVLHRWLLVGLLTVFGGLSGVLYIRTVTPVYEAESQLEMSVRRPKVINNEAVIEDYSLLRDADIIFNTRFAKFKSPAMERLATAEFFKEHPASIEKQSEDQYTLAAFIREVNWVKDPKANIVYVSYQSTDAEFASHLVNILTRCAGVLMMQENQALSDEAVKWLVSQVEEQRNSLEEVEKQLAAIRKELQLDSLQQRKITLGLSLASVAQEKEALISRLSSRKTIYEFVVGLQDAELDLEVLPTGLPKEEQLNELIRSWRTANNEWLLMADRYTKLHPEYRKAKEKETRARKRLEQFIELSSKAVLNEISLLEKQVKQVDVRIGKMKIESLELEQSVVSGTQKVQRLERKRDAADNAYQTMLQRMEEARLSADENMAYTRVIRNAAVPLIPIHPNKLHAVAFSLFLGFFVGAVMAIIAALLMDKVVAVSDLKSLNLNVLGIIPTQKKMVSRGELATIGLRDKFSHIVEIFAGITAVLSSKKFADKTQMLLVCSVMPEEGKTISACNLAINFALNGSKTLLIDADLRRPQLINVFNIDEEHPSLLEWLSAKDNRLSHEELITRGIIEKLDIITSRPIREINPAELLGRGNLVELLNWARGKYDRIIIDSPPLGPVGDAQVLANLVDSVILVSRLGKTRRRALKFALSRFYEIDAHVLGCIANDVPHSLAGLFGGAEGYGYSYGAAGSYKSYGRDA